MTPSKDEGAPQRWQRVEQLYHAALGHDAAERPDFLREACAGDAALLREVESLLAADADSQHFLQPLPDDLIPGILARRAPPEPAPAAVGRYRIVRLLGAGGMGAVYEAEQESPRRTVALKIIKPGLATPELVHRFQQEADALGRLQHPGIARIYEASTADTGFGPQPYFAMELIHGPSLLAYADTHRLSTPQRLELAARVCDAVQHAHQRGIIHRDLKPANILVDETGQPKVLDFGVARMIGGEASATLQTHRGELVGTLAYMSPEQITADPLDVDTRSDVYALGVILYELLAGRLPHPPSGSLDRAVQTIREEDAPHLGSLNRAYRGDIETIVAKALEKDKVRRYASATELAADIRRYLRNEPIAARPPSAGYQLRKFAARHKALVASAAAILFVLTAGIIASTAEAARATRAGRIAAQERKYAEANAEAAKHERDRAVQAEYAATEEQKRALAEASRADRAAANARAAARRADMEAATAKAVNDFLRKDVLAQAGAVAQASANLQPDPDLKVRIALDRAAARIPGAFDGRPLVEAAIRQTIGDAYSELGLYSEAGRQMSAAVELRIRALGPENPETLSSMNQLGELYIDQGKFDEAGKLLTKVLDIRRRVLGPDHRDTLNTMGDLAAAYRRQSKYSDAERLTTTVFERESRTLGSHNPETLNTMAELARLNADQSHFPAAESLYLKFLDVSSPVFGAGDPRRLAVVESLAQLYRRQGKHADAEKLLDGTLTLARQVLGPEHTNTAAIMTDLALVYRQEGKYAQAEELYTGALEIQSRVLGEENPATLATITNLANLYRDRSDYRKAEPLIEKVLAIRRRLLGDTHSLTLRSFNDAAVFYRDHGDYPKAERLFSQAIAGQRRLFGDEGDDTLSTEDNLGVVLGEEGKYADAELLLARVVGARRRLSGPEHAKTLRIMNDLAVVRREQHRYPEAEALFREVLEARSRNLGPDHPDTLTTMYDLALLYEKEGKLAEAQSLASDLVTLRRSKLGPRHRDTANALALLAGLRLRAGQCAEAEPFLREALSIYDAVTPDNWRRFESRSMMGASLSGQRRYAEAEPLLLSAYSGLLERRGRMPAFNQSSVEQAGASILDLYRDWGNPGKLAEWRERLAADRVEMADKKR